MALVHGRFDACFVALWETKLAARTTVRDGATSKERERERQTDGTTYVRDPLGQRKVVVITRWESQDNRWLDLVDNIVVVSVVVRLRLVIARLDWRRYHVDKIICKARHGRAGG